MKKSITSNGSKIGAEGSEPIDLTRISYSEIMSDQSCHFDNNLSKEIPIKKPKFKGKNKIDIEFITKKSRRQSTFSKRKTGLMKKAYELAELTGAEVLLMIASDTNHVYTYGTNKMKPVFESEQGKLLIEACLNSNGNLNNDLKNLDYIPTQNESSNHEYFSAGSTPLPTSQTAVSSSTNHIGQLLINVDSSSLCGDSKLYFPISISNSNSSGSTNTGGGGRYQSTGTKLEHFDNHLIVSSNAISDNKSDNSSPLLMPISMATSVAGLVAARHK